MDYICETDFKFSELARTSLEQQIEVAMQHSVKTNVKISLSNPGCFTCSATQSLLWRHSIAGKEINTKFPTFYYIHIRLINKINPTDWYKLTEMISEKHQTNAVIMNLTPAPVSIHFYKLNNIGSYSSEIHSKALVPNVFYLIDQSIPHRYVTMENSAKVFSASSSRRLQIV